MEGYMQKVIKMLIVAGFIGLSFLLVALNVSYGKDARSIIIGKWVKDNGWEIAFYPDGTLKARSTRLKKGAKSRVDEGKWQVFKSKGSDEKIQIAVQDNSFDPPIIRNYSISIIDDTTFSLAGTIYKKKK